MASYSIHKCVIYKNNDWIISTRIEECIRNNDVLIFYTTNCSIFFKLLLSPASWLLFYLMI